MPHSRTGLFVIPPPPPPSSSFLTLPLADGVIAVGCAMQGEAAIFIVAQTIPVIRVLLQPGDSSSIRRISSSRQVTATKTKGDSGPAGAGPEDRVQSIALVQLSTGRIVPADSEEGRAFQRQEEAGATAPEAAAPVEQPEQPASAESREAAVARDVPRGTMISVDDEVHKIWEEMGLSRRAWSKSPSPSPGPRDAAPVGSVM